MAHKPRWLSPAWFSVPKRVCAALDVLFMCDFTERPMDTFMGGDAGMGSLQLLGNIWLPWGSLWHQ